MRSYIINRSQTFVVNGIQSTPKRLGFGVPQGSVLGPILVVLYTHPVSRIIRQCGSDFHKFSDDTQLFNSATPAEFGLLVKQTEQYVEHVKVWVDSQKFKNLTMTKPRRRQLVLASKQASLAMSILG